MIIPTKSYLAWLNKIADLLNRVIEFSGKAVAWLVLLLVILVGYDVTMRYLFNAGSITLQELEWHLFSLIFLIGAAYTFKHDGHVRLDVLYQSRFMNDQRRAWVNLFGDVFLLIPFCLLVIISSWPFIQQAFIHMEGSPDPGGLPYRWLIKSAIPAGFVLLILQGIADICKNIREITDQS